ncbi:MULTISPECIES: phosphatidate cytidylyltransferase [Salimicrobium]|uniref:Phosphatidate cytidylyltransferase n=3 Tax=Salimicrobium TaxID=351195 RepID=K2GQV9_9BACI|nr:MULTISPECIES: phosphatidate cytidylyltransferase [Salimicrobium]AKG04550.1 phosphatidate cytidylyltransferase [Salimicrobium jeotgali]EKE32764.1 phosphatidate cytidylyltransferase [Salimicrobium jeotgali]MBM7695248.1 phosphatidate cytidylyltransferase [Salimicrobium jeotgali]SDX30442.1 phosphatidate cytidylyltransferase [Salimicrobium album]SIS63909.1 phosphatidate cytidylyltransferase [Salimicrobium salexigens]
MKQRTVTAIIAGLIFIPIVLLGGTLFTLFVYLLASIAIFELMRMKKIARYSVSSLIILLFMWALMLPEINSYELSSFVTKAELSLVTVLLLLSYTVLVNNKFTFDDAGFLLISAVYVGMGFYYLIETRIEGGLDYVFYALFVVWATDTGAYVFGRMFGKRKLWPKISPKKTVEGALGGVALACITAVIFQIFHPLHSSMFVLIAVTILISVAGQIGDLVESAFKRHYLVKDSGNILPGHGGVLDRFDSLIFMLPVLHLINFIP